MRSLVVAALLASTPVAAEPAPPATDETLERSAAELVEAARIQLRELVDALDDAIRFYREPAPLQLPRGTDTPWCGVGTPGLLDRTGGTR